MRIAILVFLAGLAGGTSPRPDWRGPLEAVGIRFVSAHEVHAMLGRGHLPRTMSVPAEDRPKRRLHHQGPPEWFAAGVSVVR